MAGPRLAEPARRLTPCVYGHILTEVAAMEAAAMAARSADPELWARYERAAAVVTRLMEWAEQTWSGGERTAGLAAPEWPAVTEAAARYQAAWGDELAGATMTPAEHQQLLDAAGVIAAHNAALPPPADALTLEAGRSIRPKRWRQRPPAPELWE